MQTLEQALTGALAYNDCWVQGKPERLGQIQEFNAALSQVCNTVYHKTPILWNELINRRSLTTQGSKARRELLTAMLEKGEQEGLGLTGYGPEVSLYKSLLAATGIHRYEDGQWGFYPALKPSQRQDNSNTDIGAVWDKIEDFCWEAREKPCSIGQLYEDLAQPPYGVKGGMIPVLLAAYLLHNSDNVGVYQEGTFIPVLGPEHFELLVKAPARFAVKFFAIEGLRSQVFRELETILSQSKGKKGSKVRNSTLLTVVKPLYRFIKQLPSYTRKTQRLSKEGLAVLHALQHTVEPDELLFTKLPQACNLPPIGTEKADNSQIAATLRNKLIAALKEINGAYDALLQECKTLLYTAFGVRSEETQLREDLRNRANPLIDNCVESMLNRFTRAAIDDSKSDRVWLESLLMIVADKTPQSWSDQDFTVFESNLAALARRFHNLEALQEEVVSPSEGVEARRITVTREDGQEMHRMIWVEEEQRDRVADLVQSVLQDPILKDNPQRQQAFLAQLSEVILDDG